MQRALEALPIRRKLTLVIMGSVFGALLVYGVSTAIYDLLLLRGQMLENVSVLSRVVGDRSTAALTFNDRDLASENLSALRASPSIDVACIFDVTGQLFARYQAPGLESSDCRVAGQSPGYRFSLESLLVWDDILLENERVGRLVVQANYVILIERFGVRALLLVLFAVLGVLVAWLIAARLQRMISDPIVRLTGTARAVEENQDYSLRAVAQSHDELGQLVHSFNSMLDTIEGQNRQLVDSRDNLELLVQNRTGELARAVGELEAFSYSVSHDLRAPLRSIDGFSLALLEDYGDALPDEAHGLLERVRVAAQRMGELIDGLLFLATASRTPIEAIELDLSALAGECLAETRAAEPGRMVEVEIEPGMRANGDRSLLRVVLCNLLGNAWKFTADTPGARVHLGQVSDDDGRVWFVVRDNGVGFDIKYADKLFQPFERLHGHAGYAGSGIGLATVKRIVERHGGQVRASSVAGELTEFGFTLG